MKDPLIARAEPAHDENRRLEAEAQPLVQRCDRLRAEMRELISRREMARRACIETAPKPEASPGPGP